MRAEMPKKYWHNMPETAAIPGLVREAGRRVGQMIERAPEAPVKRVPIRALAAMAAQEPDSLAALNAVIRASAPLVPGATQAVLGEGAEHGEGHGRAQRVAAEGGAVLAGREQLAGGADGHGRADGQAAAESLGEREDVGRDARPLVREERSGAGDPGLHLVEDEERAGLGGEDLDVVGEQREGGQHLDR